MKRIPFLRVILTRVFINGADDIDPILRALLHP